MFAQLLSANLLFLHSRLHRSVLVQQRLQFNYIKLSMPTRTVMPLNQGIDKVTERDLDVLSNFLIATDLNSPHLSAQPSEAPLAKNKAGNTLHYIHRHMEYTSKANRKRALHVSAEDANLCRHHGVSNSRAICYTEGNTAGNLPTLPKCGAGNGDF